MRQPPKIYIAIKTKSETGSFTLEVTDKFMKLIISLCKKTLDFWSFLAETNYKIGFIPKAKPGFFMRCRWQIGRDLSLLPPIPL